LFIYANDGCYAIQADIFMQLECALIVDPAPLAQYCWQWCLKPRLPRQQSWHELNIFMNGQHLKH